MKFVLKKQKSQNPPNYDASYKKYLVKVSGIKFEGHDMKRLLVLCLLIKALVKGRNASLQQLGNSMDGNIDIESKVKKAKRWLMNKYTTTEFYYIPFLKNILAHFANQKWVYVAIDGSTIGKGCMALMVSIIWKKRSIPICWTVRQAPKGHFPQEMHVDLFEQFANIIAEFGIESTSIVLLGDGEFDGDQLINLCQDKGWNYVFKTAKDTKISDTKDRDSASNMGDVLPNNGSQYYFMPHMYIKKAQQVVCNALVWHKTKFKRPLYLLSNLEDARHIAKAYKKRYIIETFFADIKKRGFNIMSTKVKNPTILSHLLIICALAYTICLNVTNNGVKIFDRILAKYVRKDRIKDLSDFQIGLRTWRYILENQCISLSQLIKPNFCVR